MTRGPFMFSPCKECCTESSPCECPALSDCVPRSCYDIVLSGFTGSAAGLNRTWKVQYQVSLDPSCSWTAPICNPETGEVETLQLAITLEDGDCVVYVWVGSMGTFSLNYGSTLPDGDTSFSGFSRESGDGAVFAVVATDAADCPSVLEGGCIPCNCHLVPAHVLVQISGIGGTCKPECSGSCSGINGSYILDYDDSYPYCTWVYNGSASICCHTGPLLLRLESSHMLMLYVADPEFYHPVGYSDGVSYGCIEWNNLTLSRTDQSNYGCTTTGATITVTSIP